MQSPQPMQNNLYREYLSIKRQVKRNIFLTTTFLQGLSHNGFFTTSFSRLSHNVFPTTSFSHRCPYIFFHTMQSSQRHNMRNLSVLYIRPKISQIRLSSVPCNLHILESIKLKPRRCTSAIYILSVCEVSEPQGRDFISNSRRQSVVQISQNISNSSKIKHYGRSK